MLNNSTLILLLRRMKLCGWRRKDSTDLPMLVHVQCVYGRSMDFLGQIRTCNKQSCLCSPSIPGCRLYGDIPLGSSNPRCSPYRTIPCWHLQQWCDISRAHPCDAKAVWKPYGNNRHGEIARPAQASLRFCQWKPIQVTAVAQETSGCTKFGNRIK